MDTILVLDDKGRDALNRLLEYIFEHELNDYEQQEEKHKKSHVYHFACVVGQALEDQHVP